MRPRSCRARKAASKCSLFAPPLRVTKTRQQRDAIKHDSTVCRENEVGDVGSRWDVIDLGAQAGERAAKRTPFAARRGYEGLAARFPAVRVHPWIDLVSYPEIIRGHIRNRALVENDMIVPPGSSRRTARSPPFDITNHVLEAVKRRVEVLTGNDQRRREANDGAMRLLRQHTLGQ